MNVDAGWKKKLVCGMIVQWIRSAMYGNRGLDLKYKNCKQEIRNIKLEGVV